ncbi:MAG: heavy metal sensor histidine kinase [Gammaproteobacteria bacterium]|nr:heavy metal sensor histidine kinase [Gammaproteobacteria bacterium]
MRRPSIALRLSLLFAVAVVVVFTAFGLYFERAVGHHFDVLDAAELRGKIEIAHRAFALASNSPSAGAEELSRALLGHPGLAMVVTDADGRDLFVSAGDRPLLDALRAEARSAGDRLETRIVFAPVRRVVVTAGPNAMAGAPLLRVAATKDSHEHEHFIAELRRQFWTAIVIGVLALGGLGAGIARWSLRPVRAIAEKAQSISANQLNSRIDVGTVPVELRELVQAFNGMLDRLAQDFQRLSDFSADLAHELRTPLSNLVTQTQVALGKPRERRDYEDLLASSLEEFDRMSRIIGDMLFMAKADKGLIAVRAEPHDLRETIERVIEYYSVLAEEKKVRFAISGTSEVLGDRGLLERLVANLVSNAVRHAQSGTTIDVTITAAAKPKTIRLDIANTGPEIPATRLTRIFDRFYRADPSRHGSSEHTGLGLAIARSIVTAHGGEIHATSSAPRTTFTTFLPAA